MPHNIKNLVLPIFLLVASQHALQAQTPNTSAQPTRDANGNLLPSGGIMTFEEEVHDFGELIQDGDASWTFKFRNTGTEAIVIENCKTTCGCFVVTSWPHEPVMPGQSEEISVKYDSHRIGPFKMHAIITSNAAQPNKLIYVKGKILPRPSPELDAAGNPVIIGK